MIFPFSIKYTKQLKSKVAPADTKKVMTFIEAYISKRTGQDIVIEENNITFRTSLFRGWSTNILAPIEKGKFKLLDKDGNSILTYEFFMYRLFIIVSFMSIAAGVTLHKVWFGLGCFVWLGGMNWITALIRQHSMLGDIAKSIDTQKEIQF
jgi:hypothetical protein